MPGATDGGHEESGELLALALSRPGDAEKRAEEILALAPGPVLESVARQVLGIVYRDRGETVRAQRQLSIALRLTRTAHDDSRTADVLSTLGITHALAGATSRGLACFAEATGLVLGTDRGRVLARLGLVLSLSGRHTEALAALNEAVSLLTNDRLWLARARNNRGLAWLGVGEAVLAEDDFAFAADVFADLGQQVEVAVALEHQGLSAAAAGRLAESLRLLDESRHRYGELGVFAPEIALAESWVLRAAGLAADAYRASQAGLSEASRFGGQPLAASELSLAAATSALITGDHTTAVEHARVARRTFKRRGLHAWADMAHLVEIEAVCAVERPTAAVARRATVVALRLAHRAPSEAAHALLTAGRICLDSGRTRPGCMHLAAAATFRHKGSAIDRITGWLAQALLCRAENRPRGMLAACERGLDVLDEYRLTLGATEARATATTHGRELVEIALRHAVRRGDARQAARWNERLRSTLWLPNPASDRDDSALVADLAAVRDASRQLADAQGDEVLLRRLRRRRDALEAAVRHRALRREGVAGQGNRSKRGQWTPPDGAALVELFELDGTLHAVTAVDGRTRLHTVGPADAATAAVQHGQALLRRLARGANPHAATLLAGAGRTLQARLLGPAADEVARSDAPHVVLVVSARHYAAPWSLLPVFAGRGLALAPSTQAWHRVTSAVPPDDGHVALVSGPGLATGGGELGALAGTHPDPVVLTGPDATADNVLAALDRARLAHVAAHGVFRSDNPQFSSLRLADGPLTVFDLERLASPPHRMVLASCDSGVMAPAGADELLGMVTCLVSLGTVGVLAPISPVNDAATVGFMVAVHAALAAGSGLVDAARRAREAAGDDPLAVATAASFLVFGA